MTVSPLSPAERLVVAADFPVMGRSLDDVIDDLMKLTGMLSGTGVVIKLNSMLRLLGLSTIRVLHEDGLGVFADLKLYDIGETLKNDGELLAAFKPEIVTVAADADISGLARLKAALPESEVLAVLILSTLNERDLRMRYGRDITMAEALETQAVIADQGNADGVICAPRDLPVLRGAFEERFTYVTPGIREADMAVQGDDQNPERVGTPQAAIKSGATRIVVGRPITQAPDPLEAVKRYIGMIEEAL